MVSFPTRAYIDNEQKRTGTLSITQNSFPSSKYDKSLHLSLEIVDIDDRSMSMKINFANNHSVAEQSPKMSVNCF